MILRAYSDDEVDPSDEGKGAEPPATTSGMLPIALAGLGSYLLFKARDKNQRIGGYASLAGAAALFLFKQKAGTVTAADLPSGSGSETLTEQALDPANLANFTTALPSEAQAYANVIAQVASEASIDPFLIAAVGYQESRWGAALSPRGPAGRSPAGTLDNGHGHGIMQIDDGTFGPDEIGDRRWAGKGNGWLAENDWRDPYVNVSKGASILAANLIFFDDKGLDGDAKLHAAIAAYNANPSKVWKAIQAGNDPDSVTTLKNYSASVVGYWNQYVQSFAYLVGSESTVVNDYSV